MVRRFIIDSPGGICKKLKLAIFATLRIITMEGYMYPTLTNSFLYLMPRMAILLVTHFLYKCPEASSSAHLGPARAVVILPLLAYPKS